MFVIFLGIFRLEFSSKFGTFVFLFFFKAGQTIYLYYIWEQLKHGRLFMHPVYTIYVAKSKLFFSSTYYVCLGFC